METILVVEDEKAILTGLRDLLETEGYTVLTARDGKQALAAAREKSPDLIILDIMLPKMNGFEVCRQLKKERHPGRILILSAKKEEPDKVCGLDLGADDYVTKPFGLSELLARIKAVLRRRGEPAAEIRFYKFGGVRVDFEKMEARRGNEKLALSSRELSILKLLIENRERIVSREEILSKVWGYEVTPATRTVDNHIVRLRKAVEEDPANPKFILSARSLGYKFEG